MKTNHRNISYGFLIFLLTGLLSCNGKDKEVWPPALPTANENGIGTLVTQDLLQIPASVKNILDSNVHVKLAIAKIAPVIDLVYHNGLPDAAHNGTGWSSWGDLCLASDGKVYSGIGNHGGQEKGESFIYCWDSAKRNLKKIADLNKITGAKPDEVHFSKVHAHIIEGRDKKIYFTGTLDDGGKAGSEEMLKKWTANIAGGKLFQYDPATGKTVVYADFPKARVTATTKYDAKRNMLYCALEGDPDGFAFGAFDMDKKEWIYQGDAGLIGMDRNFMLDNLGNVYFNGPEIPDHTGLRLKAEMDAWRIGQKTKNKGPVIPASILPGPKKRLNKNADKYTTLWKYDPVANTVAPTRSYFKSTGFRSATRESVNGYIYGTTMGGELFRYAPAKDELIILGSNFLVDGEYITVCDLSYDERYIYYLPGAHGSAGFSGTPVIQYDIASGEQKALAFLSEPMTKAFNYAPGGTYGIKISYDGSALYVGLNGSPSDASPKSSAGGFGLTSFAIIHIPSSERAGK